MILTNHRRCTVIASRKRNIRKGCLLQPTLATTPRTYMLFHCTKPRLIYIPKTYETPKTIQRVSFGSITPLDKPPRHMRKDHPSIFFLRRLQLDRRPTTSLKQVLPSRAIQVAIAHCVWPDSVVDHFAMSAPGLYHWVERYIR